VTSFNILLYSLVLIWKRVSVTAFFFSDLLKIQTLWLTIAFISHNSEKRAEYLLATAR